MQTAQYAGTGNQRRSLICGCSPPVGLNLFIASHRFQKDITEIYWATQPFLIVSLLAVIILAFWPDLSLMLLDR